jgi:hypothetical protein
MERIEAKPSSVRRCPVQFLGKPASRAGFEAKDRVEGQ